MLIVVDIKGRECGNKVKGVSRKSEQKRSNLGKMATALLLREGASLGQYPNQRRNVEREHILRLMQTLNESVGKGDRTWWKLREYHPILLVPKETSFAATCVLEISQSSISGSTRPT